MIDEASARADRKCGFGDRTLTQLRYDSEKTGRYFAHKYKTRVSLSWCEFRISDAPDNGPSRCDCARRISISDGVLTTAFAMLFVRGNDRCSD